MTPALTTTIAEQIAELEGLLERATKGPWLTRTGNGDSVVYVQSGQAARIADVHSFSPGFGPSRRERDANAALIIAAINALPTLISALKAGREDLEGEIERLQKIAIERGNKLITANATMALAEAERDDLKAELEVWKATAREEAAHAEELKVLHTAATARAEGVEKALAAKTQ